MTEMAAHGTSWTRIAGASALLLFAPLIVLTALLVITGGQVGNIIWVWLGLSLAAGASGLFVIGLANWIRALLALTYAATMVMPLFIYAIVFGCAVYKLCP